MVCKSYYLVVKGVLCIFIKMIVCEVGQYGICCNCVVFGVIVIDFMFNYVKWIVVEKGVLEEEVYEQMFVSCVFKVYLMLEDVVNLVLFFVFDQVCMIIGQLINVDVGLIMV